MNTDLVTHLPAAHLPDLPGTIHADRWIRWVGGAPQEGRGPIFAPGGMVYLPAGTQVEVTVPPLGMDPGQAIITWPADVRERWGAFRAGQLDAKAGRPATREDLEAIGLPADWDTEPTHLGTALIARGPRDAWGAYLAGHEWTPAFDLDLAFWRVGASGRLYGQTGGGQPWFAVGPAAA